MVPGAIAGSRSRIRKSGGKSTMSCLSLVVSVTYKHESSRNKNTGVRRCFHQSDVPDSRSVKVVSVSIHGQPTDLHSTCVLRRYVSDANMKSPGIGADKVVSLRRLINQQAQEIARKPKGVVPQAESYKGRGSHGR